MISQIFNKDILKILTIFSVSPGSRINRKELKEKTLMSNVILDNAISLLLSSKILKKEKRLLYLNFENDKTKQIINLISNQYKELRELPFNVYFSIIELAHLLSKYRLNVYLFGSYAKLVFKEDSDIDIAVISDKIKQRDKKEIDHLVKKLESKFNKNIETHYFTRQFYKNKKDPLVKEILKNGIKLI